MFEQGDLPVNRRPARGGPGSGTGKVARVTIAAPNARIQSDGSMIDPWEGFTGERWRESIGVRDFIQNNYAPYDGDASFLSGPTDKTLRVWDHLEKN